MTIYQGISPDGTKTKPQLTRFDIKNLGKIDFEFDGEMCIEYRKKFTFGETFSFFVPLFIKHCDKFVFAASKRRFAENIFDIQ